MTDDLTAFLNARLNEDEHTAGAADPGPWTYDPDHYWNCTTMFSDMFSQDFVGTWTRGYRTPIAGMGQPEDPSPDAAHIARWHPTRVLAEIDAKRRIIAEHLELGIEGECARCVEWDEDPEGDLCATPHKHPCKTLRLLALPYAAHPDYRKEWRP